MHRLIWYFSRLSAMSPTEVLYRLQQAMITLGERIAFTRGRRSSPRRHSQFTQGYDSFRRGYQPFFFNADDRHTISQLIKSEFSASFTATFDRAERVMQHEVELFSRRFRASGDDLDWHRNLLTGYEWPRRFWAALVPETRTNKGGVLWVWGLNRHQDLVTLGKAFFLTGDEKFATEVLSNLQSWMRSNPQHLGVNWTSPLELAIRLINWTWALQFIRESQALTQEAFVDITASIQGQAEHIHAHLSRHSSANNHLIGEAAGLAVIGMCFPWLPAASQWVEDGLNILTEEIERQVLSDGVPAEQAIKYLAFDIELGLLTWRLAELNSRDVPGIWHQRLGAACDFVATVMDENGNVPQLGDSDDAEAIKLDMSLDANVYRSMLAGGAAMLNRSDLKVAAGGWDEKSQWLLGDAGRMAFNSLAIESETPASRLFPEGGYSVMRGPRHVLTLDFGPLGYLSTAAHGHADCLNLLLHVEGEPTLVDSGTYAYQEGAKWRVYFRGTAAHNTVIVDRQDQSEQRGTFLWGRRATANLVDWKITQDYELVVAEHDGYSHLGVVHRRAVLAYKHEVFMVVDDLRGSGQHEIELLWHFAPNFELSEHDQEYRASKGKLSTSLYPLWEAQTFTASKYCGEANPIQGWYSDAYGSMISAPVLSFRGTRTLPIRMGTLIDIEPGRNKQIELVAKLTEFLAQSGHG